MLLRAAIQPQECREGGGWERGPHSASRPLCGRTTPAHAPREDISGIRAAEDRLSEIGATGRYLGVRPNIDISVDEEGRVETGVRG